MTVLRERSGIDSVMTLNEYQNLVQQTRTISFDRNNLTNFAFVGPLMNVMRAALPSLLKHGPALVEAARTIADDYRQTRESQR